MKMRNLLLLATLLWPALLGCNGEQLQIGPKKIGILQRCFSIGGRTSR